MSFAQALTLKYIPAYSLQERIEMPLDKVNPFVDRLRNLFDRIARLRCPTIAFIDGAALGGGLEMVMACDLRYASTDRTIFYE